MFQQRCHAPRARPLVWRLRRCSRGSRRPLSSPRASSIHWACLHQSSRTPSLTNCSAGAAGGWVEGPAQTLPSDHWLRTAGEHPPVNSLDVRLLSSRPAAGAHSPFWKLPVARAMGAWTWSPVSTDRAWIRATPSPERGKSRPRWFRRQKDPSHAAIYQPAAAKGEKMSMPPPSASGSTQPLSCSQNSLCRGVSSVSSDRRLSVWSRVAPSPLLSDHVGAMSDG